MQTVSACHSQHIGLSRLICISSSLWLIALYVSWGSLSRSQGEPRHLSRLYDPHRFAAVWGFLSPSPEPGWGVVERNAMTVGTCSFRAVW